MAKSSVATLRLVYVAALSAIALLTLLSDLLLRSVVEEQKGVAATINDSGRQRMRSQRIASLAAQKLLGDQTLDAELNQEVDALEKTHWRLVSFLQDPNLTASLKNQLEQIYYGDATPLGAAIQNYIALAREFAAQPGNDEPQRQKAAKLFSSANSNLLVDLDRIVSAHQTDSDLRIATFQRYQLISTFSVIFLLIIEALYIFGPMIQRLVASYEAVFENAAVGVATVALDGRFQQVNRKMTELYGLSAAELENKNVFAMAETIDTSFTLAQQEADLFAKVKSGQLSNFGIEKRIARPHGKAIWVEMTVSLMRDGTGNPVRYVCITRNIDERKHLEETRHILIAEINHRVKNTLAVIQGIVAQMLASSPDPKQFSTALMARIQSISRAHDLLNDRKWKPLRLMEVINLAKAGPFAPYAARILIEGDDVDVPAQTALVLNMAVYELLTNALKHGALSNSTGSIVITTTVSRDADGDRVHLRWQESGGPEVSPKARSGYGSFMLGRGVEFSLNGTSKIDLKKSGLLVDIEFPIPAPRDTVHFEAESTGYVS